MYGLLAGHFGEINLNESILNILMLRSLYQIDQIFIDQKFVDISCPSSPKRLQLFETLFNHFPKKNLDLRLFPSLVEIVVVEHFD